jgi:hypothetical protein
MSEGYGVTDARTFGSSKGWAEDPSAAAAATAA